MKLLRPSNFELVDFMGDVVPTYAIMSHTWDVDEVSFEAVRDGTYKTHPGFEKIEQCCTQATLDGLEFLVCPLSFSSMTAISFNAKGDQP